MESTKAERLIAGEATAGEGEEQGLQALWERHGEALLTVLCASGVALGWATGSGEWAWLSPWLYIFGYLVGGFGPARDALTLLFKERELDVDLLMVVAAVGSAAIGYWWEGGILIFIFSLAGTLETYAEGRTRRAITALMSLKPAEANRMLADGKVERIAAGALQLDDLVLIRPGERVPADGTVREGFSAVNQAAITGESAPVDKQEGDEVFAGTINGNGALVVRVTRSPEDTLLSRIIRLVSEAREEKPQTALFIDNFERTYSKLIVLGALLMAVVPPLAFGWSWSVALYRALILMVAAAPCSLTMSIMPTLISGIATAAKQGVLLKGARHLESLGAVKCIAFDKTGTLTRGEPQVTDVEPLSGATREQVLAMAASVEARSEHPLAEAILRAAGELNWQEAQEVEAIPGKGIRARVGGQVWKVGRPEFFADVAGVPASTIDRLEGEGKTVVLVGAEGEMPVGILALRDELRPGAREAVAALRKLGVQVAMLTGDNRRTAQAIASAAGIEQVHYELLPEQKVDCVKALLKAHGPVAMVGDGVNDAPALATATVGIAMGRKGTDVAMETADVVLMGDDLAKLAFGVRLGRRAGGVVKQNLVFATGMISLLILTAFTGWLSMAPAVVGHEGSTLLVTLNGLRLLRRI